MKKTASQCLVLTILMVILTLGTGSTFAVTFGELDGDQHPYVGLMVFDVDGYPAWRCSGTLLAPTIMLTAGHCTIEASGGRVWFESNVDEDATDYPYGGGTSIEFSGIYTHPDYEPDFINDIGIVVLSEPVVPSTYGVLAPVGFIDGVLTKRGLKDLIFNPVGYGLQSYVPDLVSELVRYTGEVLFIATKDENLALFTNTPSNRMSGGTCFGDSGGPFLYGETNLIVATVSTGTPNCIGNDSGSRVDTNDAQDFINSFLD